MVWTESKCPVDARKYAGSSVAILPEKSTMVGGRPLRELRTLKEVVIPDGVLEVGEQWFKSS